MLTFLRDEISMAANDVHTLRVSCYPNSITKGIGLQDIMCLDRYVNMISSQLIRFEKSVGGNAQGHLVCGDFTRKSSILHIYFYYAPVWINEMINDKAESWQFIHILFCHSTKTRS